MDKKKVVFFGTKKIGLECLKILYGNQSKLNYEIIGVLTNKKSDKIKDYSLKRHLNVLNSLSSYLILDEVDILISIQYHKILNLKHIKKAKEISINLHMAPLPEYRGCNQFSLAIIEEKAFFGTTIHKLEEGIDDGDILFETRFKIPQDCWIEELYEITYSKSLELFKKSLPEIISLKFKPISQIELTKERGSSIHFRKEIEKLKKIDLSLNKNEIEKYLRATMMNGFDPPYAEINGKKIYFKKEVVND